MHGSPLPHKQASSTAQVRCQLWCRDAMSKASQSVDLHVQAYQHIYLAALYGLLAIKSILVDDFLSISTGQIGPVNISKLTTDELAVFWGGKLLWLAYFIVLPAAYSHHGWLELAALWLLSEAVTGWILALMFQVHASSA